MKVSTIFLIAIVLGFVMFGYYHEQAHVSIFERDGIKSRVDYFYEGGFATMPEEPCKTDGCVLSNNINEVVGYNLTAFYFLLSIGIYIMISLTEENNQNFERR